MKKTIVALFLACIILTGCTKVTKDVAINETKNTSTGNLIIEHPAEETFTEEELVTYIDSVNYQVEELTSKEKLTEKEEKILENTFITLTDFIFYGGVINGKTFEELTIETKQKILSIYEKLRSCGSINILRSLRVASVVVIILYVPENLCSILLRVSSANAIVGTIITTLSGLRIEIKASMMKLLPKLVGALRAILSPANNRFRTLD